ncbi:Sec-independent protein translocase protein TatA [Nocardia nova SH22a]|uniref:Sec-independent protein translocase protein TatA n=1 Tax=Nocardia nova SH22a TaxID=1415166 RepID=W5TSC5_9NOCA|nr:Sec-independent protein translocase subunit TatA [Nocardia nova]AHH20111.1 Sec-independent protein translocase protein TatA [Nocardia nova SH22a]
MGSLSATHWLVIAGLFIVLFGAKRLPDAARSMGRSLRIFKSEVQEMQAAKEEQQAAEEGAVTTKELPASPPDTSAPVASRNGRQTVEI